MWCVASADVESVKPTQQRQDRDGLLLITKQPSPHLPMAGSSRPKAAPRTQQKTHSKAGLLLKAKLQALQTYRISRHYRCG